MSAPPAAAPIEPAMTDYDAERAFFGAEHRRFRERIRPFVESVVAPAVTSWDTSGRCDRATWRRLGDEGLLGLVAPPRYNGAGLDFRYNMIVMEELARVRAHALMFWLHADVGLSYLLRFGSAEQKERYVPALVSGEILVGIALTEPQAGSDLTALATRGERCDEHYRITGEKAFISHAELADLFIVAARTQAGAPPALGITLFLVEATSPGFRRLGTVSKVGLRGQDTGALALEGCLVPVSAALGRENRGFAMVLEQMERERLCLALTSTASCRRTLADASSYARRRRVFGAPLAAMQNTQFVIATLATELRVGQAFVDDAAARLVRGEALGTSGTAAKLWASTLQRRVATECLQLMGAAGLVRESPLATDYLDAAVQTVHGGSTEVLKHVIARELGLS